MPKTIKNDIFGSQNDHLRSFFKVFSLFQNLIFKLAAPYLWTRISCPYGMARIVHLCTRRKTPGPKEILELYDELVSQTYHHQKRHTDQKYFVGTLMHHSALKDNLSSNSQLSYMSTFNILIRRVVH